MSTKWAILFAALFQICVGEYSYTKTNAASGSSVSSSSVDSNSIITAPQQLQDQQAKLENQSKQLSESLSSAQQQFHEIAGSWLPKEIMTVIEDSFKSVSKCLDNANEYIVGSNNLLIAASSSKDASVWFNKVRKLQSLGDSALAKTSEEIATIQREVAEINKCEEAAKEAQQQQYQETKAQMDAQLQNLLKQTMEYGYTAKQVLQEGLNQWYSILRQQIGQENEEEALSRLQAIAEPTMTDLSRMRPEDLESTLTDAHHCMDEVKRYMVSSGVSEQIASEAVNPYQQKTFNIIVSARKIE